MLFSIIIPVYNAENDIERCIGSIRRQSCQDFEILAVDDQSQDGSWKVMQRLALEDERLHCMQISHGGPGTARNRALDMAVGEYVLFLDADDYWLDEKLLERLAGMISHNRTDVFMYQMVKVTDQGRVLKRYRKPLFVHDQVVLKLKSVYKDLVADGQALASACNKCVRRQLLTNHDIRFVEDLRGEDIDWVFQLFSYVRTICLLNIDAYAYTQHKRPSRSSETDFANDLVQIVACWSEKLKNGRIVHARAVAGLVAFEYGICMGNYEHLSVNSMKLMKKYQYLLKYGLDRKTRLIYRFYKVFGYDMTCFCIRLYLLMRRIW